MARLQDLVPGLQDPEELDVALSRSRGPLVSGAGFADAAHEAIAGQQAAQNALADLRGGTAPADALLTRLDLVMALGGRERLRAFMREIQKRLERGPG